MGLGAVFGARDCTVVVDLVTQAFRPSIEGIRIGTLIAENFRISHIRKLFICRTCILLRRLLDARFWFAVISFLVGFDMRAYDADIVGFLDRFGDPRRY